MPQNKVCTTLFIEKISKVLKTQVVDAWSKRFYHNKETKQNNLVSTIDYKMKSKNFKILRKSLTLKEQDLSLRYFTKNYSSFYFVFLQ